MVTVSVVIPAYNSADTIARAIDSVRAQTVDDIEILVIDDGSADDTAEIVTTYDDPRVECIVHETNRGGAAARNSGIERATGAYIAFLDADDEWHPQKLDQQLACLESRSAEWVAAYCNSERIHPSTLGKLKMNLIRRKARPEGGSELIENLLLMNFELGGTSTLVVESDVVDDVGGFDERFPRHQDWEFLVRVLKRGKLAHVDETLVTKHVGGTPNLDDLERAKELYLDSFAEEVSALEAQGHDVTGTHWYDLAMACLQRGEFRRGITHLRKVQSIGTVSPRSLVFTAGKGFKHRLLNASRLQNVLIRSGA